MTRILADLPNEDIKWLDQLAAERGAIMSMIIRWYRPPIEEDK